MKWIFHFTWSAIKQWGSIDSMISQIEGLAFFDYWFIEERKDAIDWGDHKTWKRAGLLSHFSSSSLSMSPSFRSSLNGDKDQRVDPVSALLLFLILREHRWSFHSTIPLGHGMIWNTEPSLRSRRCRKPTLPLCPSALNCTCPIVNRSKFPTNPDLSSRSIRQR